MDITQHLPQEGVAGYRPPQYARRSRPLRRGVQRNVANPKVIVEQVCFLPSTLTQNTRIQEPNFEYQDEPETLDEEERLALSLGDVIRLDAFDLGPPVTVAPECTKPLVHSAVLGSHPKLTAIESLHEFIPQPGQHGILYINRLDFPDGLVLPHP